MRLTYSLSIGHELKIFPISSRIITSNLMQNDKIDEYFSPSAISTYYKSNLDVTKLENDIAKKITSLTTWRRWMQVCISTKKYKDEILNSLKTDVILYGASLAHFDFIPVIHLLNNGVKVVLGGPSSRIKNIRQLLLKYGAKPETLKNLIIVKGYVGQKTDFYNIIKNWKDVCIENEIGNVWKSKEDYLQKYLNASSKINNFKIFNDQKEWMLNSCSSIVMFNSECWYGKCKFCSYPSLPKLNFTVGFSEENITMGILKILKKYGTNQLYFSDDYFSFNKKYKRILKNLKSKGIKISVYTGIHYLMDEKLARDINEHVDYIRVGMESTSDFSLSYITKGYNYEDIKKAVKNIIKFFDRDKKITFSVILDLPNTTEKEILKSYENMKDIKDDLRSNGFNGFSLNPLLWHVGKSTKNTVVDNKFVFETSHDEKYISGRYIIFKLFDELGVIDKIYKEYSLPLLRMDENGNKLRSDLDIIPKDLYDYLFEGWG